VVHARNEEEEEEEGLLSTHTSCPGGLAVVRAMSRRGGCRLVDAGSRRSSGSGREAVGGRVVVEGRSVVGRLDDRRPMIGRRRPIIRIERLCGRRAQIAYT